MVESSNHAENFNATVTPMIIYIGDELVRVLVLSGHEDIGDTETMIGESLGRLILCRELLIAQGNPFGAFHGHFPINVTCAFSAR